MDRMRIRRNRRGVWGGGTRAPRGIKLVDDDLFKDENMTKIDEIRERMLKSILENDNKK